MNTTLPSAELRERRVKRVSWFTNLTPKRLTEVTRSAPTGAIRWWQLQVASLTLPVLCTVGESIYIVRLRRPYHCGTKKKKRKEINMAIYGQKQKI